MTIRRARPDDVDQVFVLATELATSFEVRREEFVRTFDTLLQQDSALVLVADNGEFLAGYLLGFRHLAFFANGPIGWVEELMVSPAARRTGVGAALMAEFESWAYGHGSALVALATRRAAPFYQALGYEESATYFRKLR
jgi:GNAT superfamily N-acetyltransferase